MNNIEVKNMLRSLEGAPVETELTVMGGAHNLRILQKEMDILYTRLNAVIDMSPSKEVYSLMTLEGYRNSTIANKNVA
jgi:hypothetical protein